MFKGILTLFVMSLTLSTQAWEISDWNWTLVRTQKAINAKLSKKNWITLKRRNHCFCSQTVGEEDFKTTCGESQKWSIASLTKLIASDWLIEKYGLDYSFKTKFYYSPQNSHLHIEGGDDPTFNLFVLTALIIKLNNMGVTTLNKVSFDENFVFGVDGGRWFYSEEDVKKLVHDQSIIQKKNLAFLKTYLNTAKWAKGNYNYFKKMNNHLVGIPKGIKLKTKKIEFNNSFEMDGIYSTWDHFSQPLKEILAYTNAFSKNGIPDYLYAKNKRSFHDFIKEAYPQLTSGSIELYNASGLPYYIMKKRHENRLTCGQALRVIDSLDQRMSHESLSVEHILTTPRASGTLENRLRKSKYRFNRSLWAKTGSLFHVSSLGGTLETKKGRVLFVLLARSERTRYISHLKKFEEAWLEFFAYDQGGLKNNNTVEIKPFRHLSSLM